MKLKTTLRIAVASCALMAAALVPAIAGPFATFNQTGSNPNPWVFTNTGATSTFTVVSGSIPVDFTYSVANGYGATGLNIPATLTFSASVAAKATSATLGVTTYDEQDMVLNSLVITADTPVGGLSNLLTVSGTGAIVGVNGGTTPAFAGDSSVGQIVNMSSDFLTFAGFESFNLAYVLTSAAPLHIQGNSYLRTFHASGTGNFSAAQATFGVPEPSTNAAFLFGGLALLGLIAFGRKTRSGSLAS